MSTAVLSSFCLMWLTPAHLLPDNHLERSVEVLVFPDRIEIRYHVGLTDAQVRAELLALGDEQIPPDDPAAALLRYQQRIAPVLASHLVVTVDGEPRPVAVVEVERREQHHLRFIVMCEAPLQVRDQPVRIEVRDTAPRGAASVECRRMALRGRGDVEVVRCTGESALVRVPRQPGPASDFRPDDPSRRIAAVCRVPALAPVTDDTPALSRVDRPVISGADQPPPLSPAESSRVAVADRPAEPNSAIRQESETQSVAVRAEWFMAVGGGLMLVGCFLAVALARRRYTQRPR